MHEFVHTVVVHVCSLDTTTSIGTISGNACLETLSLDRQSDWSQCYGAYTSAARRSVSGHLRCHRSVRFWNNKRNTFIYIARSSQLQHGRCKLRCRGMEPASWRKQPSAAAADRIGYQRVNGRSHSVKKRISTQSFKIYATSQPPLLSAADRNPLSIMIFSHPVLAHVFEKCHRKNQLLHR